MSYVHLAPAQQTPQTQSCLNRVLHSKLVDGVLIISAVALLVIGVLATLGVLNFMGSASTQYLSYAAYAGFALLFIAEVIKLALRAPCINRTKNLPTAPIKRNQPLTVKEIRQLKEAAKIYAKQDQQLLEYINKVINTRDLKRDPVGFMAKWVKQRGGSEEFRIPEDDALSFFRQELGKIRDLSSIFRY